jgi:hypothetical protein
MEGDTVWYLIDIEVTRFQKEMNQYKTALVDAVVMVNTDDGEENSVVPVLFLL